MKNRAGKIRGKKEIVSRYVKTTKYPADIASRGMSILKMGELWWKGSAWLRDSENWPSNVKAKATSETEKEVRIRKDIMTSTTLKKDVMD